MQEIDDIVNEIATEALEQQAEHDLPLIERIAKLEAENARLTRERDQALAQRDKARRLACYARTRVDPKLVRRIELIALKREADAAWGSGEGKRLFPDVKETDR